MRIICYANNIYENSWQINGNSCKTKAIFCTKLFINHYLVDDAMADDVCHNFLTT